MSEAADAALKAANPASTGANQDQVWESFWGQAANGQEVAVQAHGHGALPIGQLGLG